MINQLFIKDFAIIKNLEISFNKGLNIITGETGAGKSIIIEAINMALGGRADTTFVRSGSQKAVIQMLLSVSSEQEPIILTREIYANGRSTCRINDEVVTLSKLNSFCKKHVDLHGQYDNQTLLNPENHLNILDSYDINGISECKEKYSELFSEYSNLLSKLATLRKKKAEGIRKKDYLQFELKEISAANLRVGEDDEIAEELIFLQNREKIISAAAGAYANLYDGEGSCIEHLMNAINELKKISSFSTQLEDLYNIVEECYYKIEDASSTLTAYTDTADVSVEKIDSLISRQEIIEGMKRKYGGSIQSILDYHEEISYELSLMENSDSMEKDLVSEIKLKYAETAKLAEKLCSLRKAAALSMESAVNKELSELNFKNTVFKIDFKPLQSNNKLYSFTQSGIDDVEFLISPNKGEALKPLAKIASGGEISRIMLAFKIIIGDFDSVPTFIFDEIDSGISGNAAGVVGQKLYQLSATHQVLCITHLPQIAAMGDYHYLIEKSSDDTQTYTSVIPMSEETLLKEIARLSGSWELTETSLSNAGDMLTTARKIKKSIG